MRMADKNEERMLKERSCFVESVPSCQTCVFYKLFGNDHTTDPYVCARNPDFVFVVGDNPSSRCKEHTPAVKVRIGGAG